MTTKAKRRKVRRARKLRPALPPHPELKEGSRAQLDTRRSPAKRESVEDPLRDWPEET